MDLLKFLKDEVDDDPEPLPDIAICSECGWSGPVSECEVDPYGDGDWESGYYSVHLCPKCKDGGCIDDYDMSDEVYAQWEEWWKRKHGGKEGDNAMVRQDAKQE